MLFIRNLIFFTLIGLSPSFAASEDVFEVICDRFEQSSLKQEGSAYKALKSLYKECKQHYYTKYIIEPLEASEEIREKNEIIYYYKVEVLTMAFSRRIEEMNTYWFEKPAFK